MKMLDLFSGIGGFALAAEWRWGKELEIAGFCEIEKYAQRVLRKNFPDVPIYDDITKLNGKDFKDIDLITGGFPCQDISIAGKGKGLINEETGERTRSGLWSEMHRIISEVRPRYALVENVPMLIHRGFERVLCDLTEIGYDCEWQIIGADEVGAWHRRKRVWIVAYPNEAKETHQDPIGGRQLDRKSQEERIQVGQFGESGSGSGKRIHGKRENVSNTNDSRHMDRQTKEQSTEGRLDAFSESEPSSTDERNVPDTNIGDAQAGRERSRGVRKESEGRRPSSDASISSEIRQRPRGYWNFESDVGRVANGISNRVDRLRGLGNAIVPQVAHEIMKRIK